MSQRRFNWTLFLAQGCGSGLLQPASGTWGSLFAVLLFAPLSLLPQNILLLLIMAAFIFGIYLCDKAAKHLKQPDPRSIVWDEMVAMWLILTVQPVYLNLIWGVFSVWALSFVLFRIFDIWKPYPIRQLEKRFGGGFGIMLDDLIAAVYSIIILYGLSFIMRSWHVLWLLALIAVAVVVYQSWKRFRQRSQI